jgi:hypothetical protein
MGWKPAERVPTTYPSEFAQTVDGVRLFSPPPSRCGLSTMTSAIIADIAVPDRPRRPTTGFEDP